MSTRLTTGLLSCLMMSVFVGCVSSPEELIRGQSPGGYPMPAGAYSGHGFGANQQVPPFPFKGMVGDALQYPVQAEVNAYYGGGHGAYHGAGHARCNHCQGRGCQYCQGQHGHPNNGQQWAPTHMYQHMYKIPQGMVYPQNPTPGAMTVYPYYTHKGPDDFFYPAKNR